MLETLIKEEIAQHGPMPIDRFMELALQHPEHGYYSKAPAIGAEADFITAPEISQIFGECIGLWAVEQWQKLGKPAAFALVEYGPGRGSLMKDMLRIIALVPEMLQAMELHLMERNRHLRAEQKAQILHENIIWHESTKTLPTMPMIHIGNEFLDVFPIKQFLQENGAWKERFIDINDSKLNYRNQYVEEIDELKELTNNTWHETSPMREIFLQDICTHITQHGGKALFIDYGYETAENETGKDTLQALYKHRYISPLTHIGEADITAYVDFSAAADTLLPLPTSISTQAAFLERYGIFLRTEQLCQNKDIRTQHAIQQATARLVGEEHMGTLFKALEVG